MAIDDDSKWLVNISFIALTFLLAFGWRLRLKLGRSDKARAVNDGRLQAQKIGILQRSWQGQNKTTELNDSDLVKLAKNAKRTKGAMDIVDAGEAYDCPWGASCPFQSTKLYDLEPLKYLTGRTEGSDYASNPTPIVPEYAELQAALEFIRKVKYGNYIAISTPVEVQKYLLRVHVDAASSYSQNRIMYTAASRIPHKQQEQLVLSVRGDTSGIKDLRF